VRAFAAALLTGCSLALVPIRADAQVVRIEGGSGERAVRLLELVVQRGDFQFVDRDTTLDAGYHATGDLLVWDSEVRLEGRVDGDVVVLGGVLFVRPGARIEGRVVTIRGTALGSARAQIGERVELSPALPVLFRREADTLSVSILPPPLAPLVALPGVLGFRRISYDRVDGLSVGWGPRLWLTRREFGPALDAWGTVRSARSRLGGGAELRLPLLGGFELLGRAERATVTPDRWIRGDLNNSLSVLAGGHDVRDYHETDRVAVMLRRRNSALIDGEVAFEPFVSLISARDRPLDSQAPWTVRGRDRVTRVNPPVTDSLIRSFELGTGIRWVGAASALTLGLGFEHAPERWNTVDFSRWVTDFRFQTSGLWQDRVGVRAHHRGTLGDTPAPPQRWTHVGGPATLPTITMAAHRGDQLVFLETDYAIPLRFVRLPFVGTPAARATFATGTAWLAGTAMPDWEQNVGAGFEASYFVVQVFVDPRIPRPRPAFQVELTLP
jgi:hypothetical protein